MTREQLTQILILTKWVMSLGFVGSFICSQTLYQPFYVLRVCKPVSVSFSTIKAKKIFLKYLVCGRRSVWSVNINSNNCPRLARENSWHRDVRTGFPMKWRLTASTSLACSRLSDNGEDYLGALEQATTNQKRCQWRVISMDQYGVSFVPQTSFRGKTSCGFGKFQLFFGGLAYGRQVLVC